LRQYGDPLSLIHVAGFVPDFDFYSNMMFAITLTRRDASGFGVVAQPGVVKRFA
jgi:hypothetical protein